MEKLSPLLESQLSDDDPGRLIGVEVRTSSPLTAQQRQELADLGASINTVAGTIVTLRVRTNVVRALADLDYVISIDSGTLGLI